MAPREKQNSDDDGKRQPANSIPKEFGRYRIERALGQGGMGAVYLAHDLQLDRKVAIKTPKFTEKSSPVLIKRFYREARSAATLQHPNICPIYDVGEIDGIHYISMAYIEGRPLSDSMRSKTFPPVPNIIRVVRKVALALHEAHAHGLVHRDLKPANIMIDHRGEPIVMDFGLARQFGSDEEEEAVAPNADRATAAGMQKVEARLTMEGTIVGSPGYMSPEQLYGHHRLIGPHSDVYALGVLLFELLTRQLPFPGDGTLMSIVNAVISDPTPNASKVRSEIEQKFASVCEKAMAKKVEDRFDSMQTFAVALTQALKSGSSESGKKDAGDKVAGRSPELVRTKEQYELARSLYQDGQYVAAASIMEKMVVGAKTTKNQYTLWAEEKLPKARTKAEEALLGDSSVDDLWGEETRQTSSTSRRRKPRMGFWRRLHQWKRKSGLPKWAFRLVLTSVVVIAMLLLAVLGKSLIAEFAGQSRKPIPDSGAKSTGTSTPPADDTATGDEPVPVGGPGLAGPDFAQRLLRLDADSDGTVSKAEIEAAGRLGAAGPLRRILENFDSFDLVPRDGVLDSNEIENVADIVNRKRPRRNGALE